MARAADVVIVGGAVMGSAVAYFLRREGFKGSVVVIEKDPGYALASTARSAGGLRQQFSTPENIAMSQFTLALLRELKSVFGPEADVGFREQGYLILASEDGRPVLAANHALQRSMGADTVLLEHDDLQARFPWLDTDGLAAGSFGQSGEGWLDPTSLMMLLRTAARDAGVVYRQDEVVGVSRHSSAIESVTLTSGSIVPCGTLINAAGPWAGALARLAGIALPVMPAKRYVYVVDCRQAPDALRQGPLTVDASGVWFRPEGRFFLTGVSPERDQEPASEDLDQVDHAFFEAAVWPGLAARVPLFEQIKVVNAWAGFYDYNTLDQNAVIGRHPEVANFYFANGFSGHGLQQAPAAGRALAELIVHGAYRTIDLARFGYERIARNEPLFELNVI